MVSQLDGLTFELYCDSVLPRVMEQIISCKDDIAQQYLMQALIQVRPTRLQVARLGTLWVEGIGVKQCLMQALIQVRLGRL